jgi:selenium-binding protein 1
MLWKADPTFYPSPKLAAQAPHEKLAYVVAFNPRGDGKPDALLVVDVTPRRAAMGK